MDIIAPLFLALTILGVVGVFRWWGENSPRFWLSLAGAISLVEIMKRVVESYSQTLFDVVSGVLAGAVVAKWFFILFGDKIEQHYKDKYAKQRQAILDQEAKEKEEYEAAKLELVADLPIPKKMIEYLLKNSSLEQLETEVPRWINTSVAGPRMVGQVMNTLPPNDCLDFFRDEYSIKDYLEGWVISDSKDEEEIAEFSYVINYMPQALKDLRFGTKPPKSLEFEHCHIMANIGHGKSSLLKQLIVEKTGNPVVVIDSQGTLCQELAVKLDNVVLIDPQHSPPALNFFANRWGNEESLNELFEFIFKALESQMTAMQSLVYSRLAKLCSVIDGGNLETIIDIIDEQIDIDPYLPLLDDNTRRFFERDFFDTKRRSAYANTKQEVKRRIDTLLDSAPLRKMFCAKDMRFNLSDELRAGKTVLLSTNKNYLKEMGASLFGRVVIAQLADYVFSDIPNRKPAYVFIDEVQDYSDDSPFFLSLFAQGRKRKTNITVAHQHGDQLVSRLYSELRAVCKTKMYGSLGKMSDRNQVAGDMNIDKTRIDSLKRFLFFVHYAGYFNTYFRADPKLLDSFPTRTTLEAMYTASRRLYGPITVKKTVEKPAQKVVKPRASEDEDESDW